MKDLYQLDCPWGTLQEIPPSPFYLYSEVHLEALVSAYLAGLKGTEIQTHFALKSNNNPHVLNFFKKKNFGLDLVSGFELQLALKAGFRGEELLFSGVGKSNEELKAAIRAQVSVIVVESRGELERLNKIAVELKSKARVGLRVNPDVDAKTHPYISTGMHEHKFGIDFEEAEQLYLQMKSMPDLEAVGMSVHIGSQMLDLTALESALDKSLLFSRQLSAKGVGLKVFDAGGGVGVSYLEPQNYPPFEKYGAILKKFRKQWSTNNFPKRPWHC